MNIANLRHMVVFGASYCQTVANQNFSNIPLPEPTEDEPLGVPFPGETYNEPELPNWVGYFTQRKPGTQVLVYNDAIGGAVVDGVCAQVKRFVAQDGPVKRIDYDKTLFCIFVGINDCCFNIVPSERVQDLFERALQPLYEAGARHFVLFNNPPRIRKFGPMPQPTPGFARHHAKIDAWNEALVLEMRSLQAAHTDVDISIFPTHDLFMDIFENPVAYTFAEKDVGQAYGGRIWMDGLHPTSAVHSIIADRLLLHLQQEKQKLAESKLLAAY